VFVSLGKLSGAPQKFSNIPNWSPGRNGFHVVEENKAIFTHVIDILQLLAPKERVKKSTYF
jgi:hypothetical protein